MAAYRVLVVEDNHEVRRMVSASIKALDAEIDVLDVPSAEEALFISTSLPLDLVVLDIRLPGMSGLDMVARLRKRRPETQIILVTGIEDANVRQQVSQAGVAAYFFKPIEINAFLDAVKHCLWPAQGEVPGVGAQPIGSEMTGVSVSPEVSEMPGVSKEAGVRAEPSVDERPSVSREPSISGEPTASGKPSVSGEPSVSRGPSIRGEPIASEKPSVSGEPGVSLEPSARGEADASKTVLPSRAQESETSVPVSSAAFTDVRSITGEPSRISEPSVSATPGVSEMPGTKEARPISPRGFQPTLDDRLNALRLQLKAASVLLVEDSGRVLEVAGNPAPLTSATELLSALMQAFSASVQVSQAIGRSGAEGLHYFSTMKQCLYMTAVDPKHALLVITSGYFDPDKLGMIDRAINLAAQDLRAILEQQRREESLAEVQPVELPADTFVDQETLAVIDAMFSGAPKNGAKEELDSFWESLEDSSSQDTTDKKGALSYDQAHELGLTPNDDQGS